MHRYRDGVVADANIDSLAVSHFDVGDVHFVWSNFLFASQDSQERRVFFDVEVPDDVPQLFRGAGAISGRAS